MKNLHIFGGIILATGLGLSACVAVPAPINTDSTQNKKPQAQTPSVVGVAVPVPVVVPVAVKPSAMHVCQVTAFTETYSAQNENRGKALLEAKNKCLANWDAMFCQDEYISCQKYS